MWIGNPWKETLPASDGQSALVQHPEKTTLVPLPEQYSRTWIRVGNFRQKYNSAEDGRDRTIGYFRRNPGCSAEQKALGIPFRILQRKRKQLRIPFRRTKIEANSWNSLPNSSMEEKTSQNSVPWNKNRNKLSEFRSELFRVRENYSE
jgi:hypothetical protein